MCRKLLCRPEGLRLPLHSATFPSVWLLVLCAPHSLDQHGSSPGVNSSESALQLFHEELLPVNTTCLPPNQRSLYLIILNSVPWPFKHEVHWADVAFICFVLFYYFWLKYSISLSFRDMFFPGPKLWPGLVWFEFLRQGLTLYSKLTRLTDSLKFKAILPVSAF